MFLTANIGDFFASVGNFFANIWASIEAFFVGAWDKFYETLIYKERYTYLLDGLKQTIIITLIAAVMGLLIGTLIALIKVAARENRKLRPLEWLANLYLTVIRGTPMVVQLMIMYYLILISADKITAATVAFGINSGAYVAELVRSGILSVDRGQTEAGRSLGLPQGTVMTRIVFPQALKNILPALGNEFIVLLKETSVAGFIGVVDLSKAGDIIRSQTYEAFYPLISVAVIYLIMVIGMTMGLSALERRLRKSDNR